MFTRTNSGLSNRSLFTGADYTLYVEGGGGVPGAGSIDVIFWEEVFGRVRPDLKLTIKPYGGKPQLEALAHKVCAGSVVNTLVAMDSDFDEILEERILHDHVVYTYGYSWESDAFCLPALHRAIGKIARLGRLPDQFLDELSVVYSRAMSQLLPYVNADFRLRRVKLSLFPKISSGRFLRNNQATHEPEVDLKELRAFYKRQLKAVDVANRSNKPSTYITSAECFLHGHTLQAYVKCFLSYTLRRAGRNVGVNDDLLEQTTIPVYGDIVAANQSHSARHYHASLSRI